MVKTDNIKHIKKLSHVIVAILSAIMIGGLLLILTLNQSVSRAQSSWESALAAQQAKDNSIHKIQQALGYGGFIHSFKNQVLRGDMASRHRFVVEFARLKDRLGHLRTLSLSGAEQAAITSLDQTINAYRDRFATIEKLRQEGQSAEQIDQVVKVSDTEAVKALDLLVGVSAQELQEAQNRVFGALEQTNAALQIGMLLIPIPLAGILLAFFGSRLLIREISLRSEAEAEAIKANETKSDFLAQVSHDLRTPLNSIMGFSEMIKFESYGPLHNPHYMDCANNIRRSGDRLVSMINDLLDLNRIERGKYPLCYEEVDVGPELESAIWRCTSGTSTPAHQIIRVVPSAQQMVLSTDRRAFQQIIDNLLTNAIKYAGDDAEITLAASCRSNGACVITVADDGVGIPEEQLDTMLHPFVRGADYQGENGEKLGRPGSGLGLYIVHNLTKLLKATLDVKSALDQGSSFSVCFEGATCHCHEPTQHMNRPALSKVLTSVAS